MTLVGDILYGDQMMIYTGGLVWLYIQYICTDTVTVVGDSNYGYTSCRVNLNQYLIRMPYSSGLVFLSVTNFLSDSRIEERIQHGRSNTGHGQVRQCVRERSGPRSISRC